jgi:hypothetical protein
MSGGLGAAGRARRAAAGAGLLLALLVLAAACGGASSAAGDAATDAVVADGFVADGGAGERGAGDGGAGEGGAGDGAAGDGAATADGGAADGPPLIVGIIATGQSLSVGAGGLPALSTTQPYDNRMLVDHGTPPLYDGVGDALALAPLVAPVRPHDGANPSWAYPNNIAGESPTESMANQLSALSLAAGRRLHTSVVSNVGEGGQAMSVIEKGGTGNAYAASLYEARAIEPLVAATGNGFVYNAVVLTHGESDCDNPSYGAAVKQLRLDYQADLQAITGQAHEVVLIHSQQSTFPVGADSTSISAQQQLDVSTTDPTRVVLAGPKYQYAYYADLIHLTAAQSIRLGIKYAQAYERVVVHGQPWLPLYPVSATRQDRVVTVAFHVPVGPLQWNEALPPAHVIGSNAGDWVAGRGFEAVQRNALATLPLAISAVAIVGDTVQITLGETPYPTFNVVVRYAMTRSGDWPGGTSGWAYDPGGRLGQLCDSDPFVGIDARQVTATVTSGSAVIGLPAAELARTSRTDLVDGPGLTGAAVVVERQGAGVKLSQAFTGASGTATLRIRSDQRNYAVQFELPVGP